MAVPLINDAFKNLSPSEILDGAEYDFAKLRTERQWPSLHILISTRSGTQLAGSFFKDIVLPLFEHINISAKEYTAHTTKDEESVREFARDVLLPPALKGERQIVLVLSGDGGIAEIVNVLASASASSEGSAYVAPTLSLLPLGTGNALYHSIHRLDGPRPSIYTQGLRDFIFGFGERKELPIYRATFSPGARLLSDGGQVQTEIPGNALYGAVVVSCAFHATLVADSDTPEYRVHGAKRFGMVANQLISPPDGTGPHSYKAKVIATYEGKDEELGDNHGYVLAPLVSNLEEKFTISPASKPLGNDLRIVRFGPVPSAELLDIMTQAYDNGAHVGLEAVTYQKVDKLRVDFQEPGENWQWRRCCVDGLIVGVEEGGYFEVELVKDRKKPILEIQLESRGKAA